MHLSIAWIKNYNIHKILSKRISKYETCKFDNFNFNWIHQCKNLSLYISRKQSHHQYFYSINIQNSIQTTKKVQNIKHNFRRAKCYQFKFNRFETWNFYNWITITVKVELSHNLDYSFKTIKSTKMFYIPQRYHPTRFEAQLAHDAQFWPVKQETIKSTTELSTRTFAASRFDLIVDKITQKLQIVHRNSQKYFEIYTPVVRRTWRFFPRLHRCKIRQENAWLCLKRITQGEVEMKKYITNPLELVNWAPQMSEYVFKMFYLSRCRNQSWFKQDLTFKDTKWTLTTANQV